MALKKLNFEKIIVVSGYKHELLAEHLKEHNVEFIYNEEWASTNNIFSLYITKDVALDGFYLFNGDVVFDQRILNDLVSTTGTAMIIDNVKSLGDEEMKVTIEDGKITDISKTIPLENAHGEYIGLMRFEKSEGEILFRELSNFIARDERGVWYENAIKNLLDKLKIRPVYTRGRKWIEVDTQDDYTEMKRLFS